MICDGNTRAQIARADDRSGHYRELERQAEPLLQAGGWRLARHQAAANSRRNLKNLP